MDKKLKYAVGIIALASFFVALWLNMLGCLKEAPAFSVEITVFVSGFVAAVALLESKKT